MTHDQADELRLLVRASARHAPVAGGEVRLIAVTGGQRAVGTTTIALNLAVALALEGRRTILVDADLERGAVAGMCGLAERGSILDVLSARRTIHEVLTRGPAGVQILPGVWAPHEAESCTATSQGRLISRLKGLGAHSDIVVVDTGCGRGSFVRRFWQAADLPLVVTTPEAVAVMDCYATIKVLLAGDASLAVQTVVNQATDERLATEVHGRLAAACRRFLGVRISAAGSVPLDPLVPEAASQARPLLLGGSGGPAAQSIERLSATVLSACQRPRSVASGAADAPGTVAA